MKKQHWFLVIGSFILGLAAGFSMLRFGLYDDMTEAMLLDRIREKDVEIARLKANVNQAPEAVMEMAAEPVEEDFLPEVNAPDDRRVRFLERMEERIDQLTATMVETYGLNEEQAVALNAVFQKQFELFRARLSPEVQDEVYETLNYTAQEMMIARKNGEDFSLRAEIELRLVPILTEEQIQIYRDQPGSSPAPIHQSDFSERLF